MHITVTVTHRLDQASMDTLLAAINHAKDEIMGTFADDAAKIEADLATQTAKLDALQTKVQGLSGVVQSAVSAALTSAGADQAAQDAAMQAIDKTINDQMAETDKISSGVDTAAGTGTAAAPAAAAPAAASGTVAAAAASGAPASTATIDPTKPAS